MSYLSVWLHSLDFEETIWDPFSLPFMLIWFVASSLTVSIIFEGHYRDGLLYAWLMCSFDHSSADTSRVPWLPNLSRYSIRWSRIWNFHIYSTVLQYPWNIAFITSLICLLILLISVKPVLLPSSLLLYNVKIESNSSSLHALLSWSLPY